MSSDNQNDGLTIDQLWAAASVFSACSAVLAGIKAAEHRMTRRVAEPEA